MHVKPAHAPSWLGRRLRFIGHSANAGQTAIAEGRKNGMEHRPRRCELGRQAAQVPMAIGFGIGSQPIEAIRETRDAPEADRHPIPPCTVDCARPTLVPLSAGELPHQSWVSTPNKGSPTQSRLSLLYLVPVAVGNRKRVRDALSVESDAVATHDKGLVSSIPVQAHYVELHGELHGVLHARHGLLSRSPTSDAGRLEIPRLA